MDSFLYKIVLDEFIGTKYYENYIIAFDPTSALGKLELKLKIEGYGYSKNIFNIIELIAGTNVHSNHTLLT